MFPINYGIVQHTKSNLERKQTRNGVKRSGCLEYVKSQVMANPDSWRHKMQCKREVQVQRTQAVSWTICARIGTQTKESSLWMC